MTNLKEPATNRNSKTPLVSVCDGRECVGFILARGKTGFEAFDCDERSLGVYPTQGEAVNAIPNNEGNKCSKSLRPRDSNVCAWERAQSGSTSRLKLRR
jgi:hypothetical protein